jgi:putative phosphoribosyl transferase
LAVPAEPRGMVLFAHGSGSSRFSPRNQSVAHALQHAGMATLLLDLLTKVEEAVDERTSELRFDIPRLAERLLGATEWVANDPRTRDLKIGYFGASTGAGAALLAAEGRDDIFAVVSRGGRPDLAGPALSRVTAATLLIVGGNDIQVIELNRKAMAQMRAPVRLEIVPGASHLFEEPGTLDKVAQLAREWFQSYLGRKHSPIERAG